MSITVTTPRSVESATRLDVSANACMIVAATAAAHSNFVNLSKTTGKI